MQHLCTCKGHLVWGQLAGFPTALDVRMKLFTVTKYKSTCRRPILGESREPRGFDVKNIGFFLGELSVTRFEVPSGVG